MKSYNRPSKVRQIYAELRSVLGDEMTSQEVLQTAALLVDLFEENKSFNNFGLREQRATFDEMPVDVAFSDGGWKVLSKVTPMGLNMFDSEIPAGYTKMKLKEYGLEIAA
jgi:hypothetical protein